MRIRSLYNSLSMDPDTDNLYKLLYKLIKEQAIQIKKLDREVLELKLAFVKLQSQIKRLQNPV